MKAILKTVLLTGLFLVSGLASAVEIKVSTKGEQLAFEPAAFSVKAGEQVSLVFHNASKSMQHNLVIGKPGTDAKIATDSIAAGAPNWTSKGAEVLFKTAMLEPTTSATITFTAPTSKGAYPFLCTFPGHSSVMKGVMTVK